MSSMHLALLVLGTVFFLLGFGGRVAARFGLSAIPLYLFGGLALGAMGIGRSGLIVSYGPLAAEIGIILLLLMLGLRYTATELIAGMRQSWRAGVVDLLVNAAPGAVLAYAVGWGPVGMLVLAGVTYVTSSGVSAKILADLGRLGNRETPVVLSVLVFEDLAMAVYLPVLTVVLAGATLLGGVTSVGISLLAVAVIMYLALRRGPLISRLVDSPDRESLMLKVLGAGLLVAGVAGAMDVSAAVGAFLLGIAVSGATADSASEVLAPLRDLFAAGFFVLFGVTTPIDRVPEVLPLVVLMVGVTTATKLWTGWWAARRIGISRVGALRAGTALIARGEFSIVIVGLAVAVAAVPAGVSAFVTVYVLAMAFVGPVAARIVEPVSALAVSIRANRL